MRYIKWIVFLLFLFLLWYLRAWFHGLVMLFYTYPVILQTLLVTIIVYFLILSRIPALSRTSKMTVDDKKNEHIYISANMIIVPLLFVILLIPGIIFANWFRGAYISQNMEYSFRSDLPESGTSIRLMPYDVAQRYAKDSLQLSQYKLGTENIALVDNKLSWTFPLTPDGLIITFLRKNKGMVYVDATQQSRTTEQVWKDMEIGEGMQIRDNLYWNLYRNRYFVTTDDAYYLTDGEEIYAAVGAVSYSYHFRYGLVYTVPRFEGVFVVDTSGNIELVSPEDALEHPVLSDNRIFPENLARIYTEAYQYRLGIINKLFIHEDQIQIQDVKSPSSKVNRQPYLMDTEEGLKWFISAEPYGASHGIFKIFIIDAQTGDIEIFELPQVETLTGPVRSVDYVRRSNPVVDWSRFDSVEPLPFIRDQLLYWKLTVIPSDAAGIAYQAFVNAHTNDVIELRTDEEVMAFLAGEIEEQDIEQIIHERDSLIEQIQERVREIDELLKQLESSE